MNVTLALRMACACLLLAAGPLQAGSIRNADAVDYKCKLHWEDLSPPTIFEIQPGESRQFEDKRVTVELVGKKDNIYVRPEERVMILNGVIRRLEGAETH